MSDIKDAPNGLAARHPPRITRLRHAEIPTAVRSWAAAFEDDPLQRYLHLLWLSSRTTPALKNPSGPLDRFYDSLLTKVTSISKKVRPAEYNIRRTRVLEKLEKTTQQVLGRRVDTMVHVDGLGTDPRIQGRGYGGALLDVVTSLADSSSQASYLESSNVANTSFYMYHGFLPVADILIGDDDPEWTEPPFVVKLMVREIPKVGKNEREASHLA
ncbi:hypothetical protein ONZ45_g4729 [Pleurotus djamor]|nr:hypothetical protein ONZ45_g4729 [Pleurotus djamor]